MGLKPKDKTISNVFEQTKNKLHFLVKKKEYNVLLYG